MDIKQIIDDPSLSSEAKVILVTGEIEKQVRASLQPEELSNLSLKKRGARPQYTFEEDTGVVAQTVINIVNTTTTGTNPHPFIVALLEGYAKRVKTQYTLPE
jgi:hypothetical protein